MARYSVLLEWDPGDEGEAGAWSVLVPAIPNLATWGTSVDHALEMAREAIQLHLYGLQEAGEDLIVEAAPPILAAVEVDLDHLEDGVTAIEAQSAGTLG